MAANVAANALSLGLNVDVVTNATKPKKERFFDQRSEQLLRVDTDARVERIEPATLGSIDFESYEAVIISDYDKGFLQLSDIKTIVERARCPVFVDTKKTVLGGIDHPHVTIKINEVEFGRLHDIRDIQKANVIVTLGGTGAQFNGKLFPAPRCDVFDVCGAGDTFLAALVFAYLLSSDLDQSIDFANSAAAISVQHVGTYVVKPSDFE